MSIEKKYDSFKMKNSARGVKGETRKFQCKNKKKSGIVTIFYLFKVNITSYTLIK